MTFYTAVSGHITATRIQHAWQSTSVRISRTSSVVSASRSHSDEDSARLAVHFRAYFQDKLSRIRQSLTAGLQATSQFVFPSRSHSGPKLADIGVVSADEVRKAIRSTAVKSSPLDALLSTLLRECVDVFVPVVAHMANLSFTQGRFGTGFAALEETWRRQRRTRQLSANLEPLDNFEDSGAVGVKQTTGKHLLG